MFTFDAVWLFKIFGQIVKISKDQPLKKIKTNEKTKTNKKLDGNSK
jgi:hypothetical protein